MSSHTIGLDLSSKAPISHPDPNANPSPNPNTYMSSHTIGLDLSSKAPISHTPRLGTSVVKG